MLSIQGEKYSITERSVMLKRELKKRIESLFLYSLAFFFIKESMKGYGC